MRQLLKRWGSGIRTWWGPPKFDDRLYYAWQTKRSFVWFITGAYVRLFWALRSVWIGLLLGLLLAKWVF